MRKSTLFISAVLTTFMLALLAGVLTLNTKAKTTETADVVTDVTTVASTDIPAPTAVSFITPEQAAELASQVLGKTDVYSVETSAFNGQSAYLVTFSAGDLVYVGPQGAILSVTPAPVVVYSAPAASQNNNKNRRPVQIPGGGGGGGGGEGGEHEEEGN